MSRKIKRKGSNPPAAKTSPRALFGSFFASPLFRFGLKFAALMTLFYVVSSFSFFDRMLLSYLELNAWACNGILDGFGQPTQVSGVTIQSPHFAMAIRRGCDAVEPTCLFCAAVLSFPAPWRAKLAGMLAGIVVLQLLNLVRIVTLYWVGIYFPTFFYSAHVELWPTAFIFVAILLFVGWLNWSAKMSEPSHAPV
jgi:exosortase/archaeosortase family protein